MVVVLNEVSVRGVDGTNASREIQQLRVFSAVTVVWNSLIPLWWPPVLLSKPFCVIVHLQKSSVSHVETASFTRRLAGDQTAVLNLTVKFPGSKQRTAQPFLPPKRRSLFSAASSSSFLVLRSSVSPQLVSVLSPCLDIQVVAGHMTVQRDLRSLRRLCWYSLSSCR